MSQINPSGLSRWANGFYVFAEIWHPQKQQWLRAIHGEQPTNKFFGRFVTEQADGLKFGPWVIPTESDVEFKGDQMTVLTPRDVMIRFTRSRTTPPIAPQLVQLMNDKK